MPHRTAVPNVTIRVARREDVPAIVRLLADDALGASREQPGEPLAQAYWDAFDAMASQTGNEVLVAIERSRERGCQLIQLTTDRSRVDAQRFYERLGFQFTHLGMKLTLS